MKVEEEKVNSLVSIIIPTYNRKNVISRAIDSCISQTYSNIEIIICDDHSTDNTMEYLKEKYFFEKRIMYCVTPIGHKGANAARNEAIRCSKGKYIVFLDSDDFMPNNSIQIRVDAIENTKYGMVYGDVYINNVDEKNIFRFDNIEKYNRKRYLMQELSLCTQSSIMTLKSIIEEIGFLNEQQKGWTDDGLVVAIGMRYPMKHCGKPVAVFISSDNSMMSQKKNMYNGCKYLVDSYKREIISEVSIFRLLIWRCRLFSMKCEYRNQEEKRYIYKKMYGIFAKSSLAFIRRFFRHIYG